ncbi:biotin--[acetyl-CoA-carboxylase] ligase [Porphyromonas sp.]|uniref:biotin--[acetyl-CoA-carboxylase] ligase n=1 Tax=Porphyromonas sp. TaxID=1924944 RepID=UPI0026DD998C|nr:biotin--[acetyl-CoA-carboxylase] ligase [Porphyromonas sp.]MDO4695122.1 biotin--[acetyl-CoA-carboxylase] ligase [Porphyromonas sp.]MDO4770233.1 biotin--[acetyl-CoA-carboxylase] ligase [Porphyromonas sp.]
MSDVQWDYNLIQLDETASTNSYLKSLLSAHPDLPTWTVVSTHNQSQGRGQRGNSWESEPYQNITLTILLRPDKYDGFEPFDLNVFVSLSLCFLLQEIIPSSLIKIKWPNDIYVGDKKIAGILIENEWMSGGISASLIGIGLNVNQTLFVSDAPNPTSIALETQQPLQLAQIQDRLLSLLQQVYKKLPDEILTLRHMYHEYLYRHDGYPHRYRASNGSEFDAVLISVTPSGLLCLKEEGKSEVSRYAFKEVSFVL